MQHQQLTEALRETIVLYALGALPPEQATAFAAHLAEGCKTCAREVRGLTSVVGTLSYAATPVQPRPEVRARLLTHIQGRREEPVGAEQGVLAGRPRPQDDWVIVRATEGIWEVMGVQGVVTKRLSPVLAQQCSVHVARMRGAVHYPLQRLATFDEVYMLVGALTVADQVLQAGDYCAVPAGLAPHITSGASGCTMLVLSCARATPHGAAATGESQAELVCMRAAERAWRQSGIDGVEISLLCTEPTHHIMTALVRMASGARLPRHRHVTDEQFYMLEGDGHVQGQILQAGDYYLAPAGTVHDVTYTDGGCLFLLLASHVEVLP